MYAVIEPLKINLEDQLESLYTAKLKTMEGQYLDGCMEWIQQARPELYGNIFKALSHIDEVWKSTLAGETIVADFDAAVTAWYELQLEAMREHRGYVAMEKKLATPITIPRDRKWTVADCLGCRCYTVWKNYPLGGGTRLFCSYNPIVKGTSKKTEVGKLEACPNGGAVSRDWLEVGVDPNPDPTAPITEPQQQAELISSAIQYLDGINSDLSGWTLWKRIEDGQEHRFAKDAGGVIQWQRTYMLEPRVII